MHAIAEHHLIDLGKQGNTAAVSELFERHYKNSVNVARRILRADEESQDAVQAAYFSAFQNLDTFRAESSFKTWITRIVVNSCLMMIRDPWRRVTAHSTAYPEGFEVLEGFSSPSPSPEKSAWCRELASAHDTAVGKLPNTLRSAYVLYAISGLSMAEVAETLDISLATTKSRVFRARGLMRQALRNVWERRCDTETSLAA